MSTIRVLVCALWMGCVVACGSGGSGGGGEPECTPGTEACACEAGACSGDGLVCEAGFCVPEATGCAPGAQGCACRDNGTCDPLDGVPMTCTNNVCVETEQGAEGTLGGPCFPNGTCGEDGGEPLECVDGRCERPGCPSGSVGCPCGPQGACDDDGARCNDGGVCELGGCAPGTELCGCDEGACEGELECVAAICRAPNALTVTVASGEVRACDIMARQVGDRAVQDVVFGAPVIGEHLRRAGRLGVSFAARADASVAGVVFRVVLSGDAPVTGEELETVTITCMDKDGNPIAEPGVEWR